MEETTKLMSIKEAAEAKKITVGRVYQLINEGRLPAQKIGTHFVISKADCDALVIHGKAGRPKKEAAKE